MNEEFLQKIHTETEQLKIIKTKKISYLGHLLRKEKYELPQLIIDKAGGWAGYKEETSILDAKQIITTKEREDVPNVVANLP